jgi:hypothetical protein
MAEYVELVSRMCEGWDELLEQEGGGGGGRMGPVFSTLAGGEEALAGDAAEVGEWGGRGRGRGRGRGEG